MENDDLWKIYEANKEWIKFADTKAIAFIAIIGVIFNILYKIGSCVIYSRNIFLYISYFGSILCLILFINKESCDPPLIIKYIITAKHTAVNFEKR